jgi:hypothetical protein
MPTGSIFHNVVISITDDLERLLDALKASEKDMGIAPQCLATI